jgi:hypothetical protein
MNAPAPAQAAARSIQQLALEELRQLRALRPSPPSRHVAAARRSIASQIAHLADALIGGLGPETATA